jgi:hypothetical protein
MNSLARSLEGQSSDGTYAPARELTADVMKRRVARRRQMLTIQAASYALNSLVLLIYAYAGTLSIAVPSTYFLSGIMLTGFFAVLSETNFNDRFEDHYLTIFQIAANIALQLGFLLAAPEIGYAFLSFLFLAFGFGALRMTSRQATIAWCGHRRDPGLSVRRRSDRHAGQHSRGTSGGDAQLRHHDRTMRVCRTLWQQPADHVV